MNYEYETLEVEVSDHVLTVSVNNPPCNVMTLALYRDLLQFTSAVEQDDDVKVVVLQSKDPDFLIAHFDISLILTMPTNEPAVRGERITDFHAMCQRMQTMNKVTIAKVAGRVGGGGSEFTASCDMRFGVYGGSKVNQMEVALGILPGGTGTVRLPRLMGRGRAMEVIMGCDDLDAETAERWGYLNRAFETVEEMDAYVDQLARRIALWPAGAIALAKQSVNSHEKPLEEGMLDEAFYFQQTLRLEEAQRNMRRSLEMGAQTREGELRMNELCVEFASPEN